MKNLPDLTSSRLHHCLACLHTPRLSRFLLRTIPILLIVIISAASLLLFAACGGTAATTPADGTTRAGETTSATTAMSFTLAELAAYDGQNGNKAYIAVDGIVYDVTALAEWGAKLHAGKFAAGKDYSAEIKKAPHPVSNLLKAVKVGVLED